MTLAAGREVCLLGREEDPWTRAEPEVEAALEKLGEEGMAFEHRDDGLMVRS
jgi:hypothetical protein